MAKAHWKPGEIVVELAATRKTKVSKEDGTTEPYGPSNTYMYLRTFDDRFRGRFTVSDMPAPSSAHNYMSMPVIPGIHVAVDPQKRTIRAVDPLGFPENHAKLRQANNIREPVEGTRGRPWDTSVIRNPSATDVKTALWELRELVDDKQAEVVEGRLPELAEIAEMEGDLKRRVHFVRTQQTRDGLVTESPNATEEEVARMLKPKEERVEKVPAADGTY